MKKCILLLLFSLAFRTVSAQDISACDTVYANPDAVAVFQGGTKALFDFIQVKLLPHLQECYKEEGSLVSSLKLQLIVDRNGRVVSVHNFKADMPVSCRKKIDEEMLNMEPWIPARLAGVAVCSSVFLPIGCIKWQ